MSNAPLQGCSAAIEAHKSEDLRSGPKSQLGEYLADGKDFHRRALSKRRF